MKYLFVKLRRDISKMWIQFFAVFMMSVLAITIYSGMEGVWYGLYCEVEDYYDETKLADVWINGTYITDEMVDDIESEDGVKAVTKAMTATVKLETDENDKPDVKLVGTDDLTLFDPIIREGKSFDKSLTDGVWLDETICDERGLEVGDTVTLSINNIEKDFVIEGTILDSEFIYYTGSVTDTVPNHKLHGYGLISEDAAADFYGQYVCNELRLDTKKDCDHKALQEKVEDILGDNYLNFSVRDDISSVSQITKEISQMQNMANLFSAVFIVLAVLSMYSTMTRLINNQTIQIGTFKALGFSNTKIRIHYLCYGFFVSLLGCLCGIFFGRKLVSRAVMRVKKATLTLPEWRVELSYRIVLVIAAIVLVCIIATLIAAQRGLGKLPAETMRNAADKKSVEMKLSKKLGYKTKWMIRDNVQNSVRWIMSIIGVAGSMVLMMAGLGFRNSINYSNEYVYEKQYTYNYKVVLNNNYTYEALEEFKDSIEDDYQDVYEYNIDIEGEKRTISVINDGDFVNLETTDGKKYKLGKDSVAITNKTAKVLNLDKGDTVTVRLLGTKEDLELEITDILASPSPQGIFVSKDYWTDVLEKDYVPNAFLLESKDDYKNVKDLDIVKESSTIKNQLSSMRIMTKSVMTIVYLMIVASVLLGCIIIYNLGMLNYIERFRDYATMKVLGFYQSEIRNIIIRDCMITTILGWMIGIPAGRKFLSVYIGIVQFKTFEWVPTITRGSFIIASVVVIACSLMVNIIVSHKVTKISMVEALKSVE